MSDATIRDQLADILRDEGIYCGDCDYGSRECPECGRMLGGFADAILAAGYRPPARVITDPAELPTGSIVVRDGVAWQLEKGGWSMRGTRARWDEPHGTGPIILLYVPTEEARDGE